MIQLLEHEATTQPPQVKGEGYGEYWLQVEEAVVALRDKRSLRGLALLGIRMDRKAQEFVASQGAASIPFLDEAWAKGPNGAIAETWGYMLGAYGRTLSRPGRIQVLSRVWKIESSHPRDFVRAAQVAPLPEAAPLVEDLLSRDSLVMDRRADERALSRLRSLRDSLQTNDLLGRLNEWLDALCLSASGLQAGACDALHSSLAGLSARESRDSPSLQIALDSAIAQVYSARDSHALPDEWHRLLAGNLEYLKHRP
jgi:hypothetical protein